MKDVVNLNTTRCSMLKNFIMYHLSKTPSLISFLIIIPLVLYFFGEVSLSDDISYISLNPNFSDLINSYSVFFFRLLYLIIIITAPIYIFLSKIHIKSYYKYCRLNITFKSICNANYYLFISLFDLVTLIVFSFILFHTGSTLSAIFVFLCMFIPSMTLMILILSYCYQISLVLAIKFLNKVNISILELFIVLLYSLCSISIIENLSFSFVMNIPFYIIFIILFVLFFIMKFLYSKTPIETIVMANQKKKEKKIIKINGSMSIMNNYFLLLFSMKDIYLEYIVTFFILLVVILNTELSNSIDIVFQFSVLFTIISNGVIYSYSKWYHLYKNEVFKKLIRIDLIFSFFMVFIISIIISLILSQKIQYLYIFNSCCTYFLLNLIQRKLNLKYVNDSNSPIIFILVYGILTFICFLLLQEGYHICIRFLMGS